jgi:flagellar hook assembly protein FlgD
MDIAGLNIQFTSGEVITPTTLNMVYPNPFNPVTTIAFSLSEQQNVTIEAYNVKGQKVATVHQGSMDKGDHTLTWNASDLPSGIYYLNFKTLDYSEITKVVLLK